MPVLKSNSTECCMCGTCERLLPGYKSKYNGALCISARNIQREDVHESLRTVIDACPRRAIQVEE